MSHLDLTEPICASDVNLLELFNMLIFDNFWSVITTQTNTYMHQQFATNKPNEDSRGTNETEMKCFIGCLLRMELIKCPSLRDYWSKAVLSKIILSVILAY